MIRYKVITKKRTSAVLSKRNLYQLKYKKGTTVFPIKNSVGVFCFRSIVDAEDFISVHDTESRGLQIVKVKPIGKAKTPKMISCSISEKNITNFYKENYKPFEVSSPPVGTICYSAVVVLE